MMAVVHGRRRWTVVMAAKNAEAMAARQAWLDAQTTEFERLHQEIQFLPETAPSRWAMAKCIA
jgi:hypothetical protein